MATEFSSPSPLLDRLPAELRNKIYTLVLTSDNDIEINPNSIKYHSAFLQTSAQIRSEASQLFYTTNSFRIILEAGQPNPAFKWLRAIDDTAVQIARLRIIVSGRAWENASARIEESEEDRFEQINEEVITPLHRFALETRKTKVVKHKITTDRLLRVRAHRETLTRAVDLEYLMRWALSGQFSQKKARIHSSRKDQ